MHSLVSSQRNFFRTHATLPISWRKQQLRLLEQALHHYENALTEALWTDLHKSYEEAYMTEFGLVYAEIRSHIRHLSSWSRARCCMPSLSVFPGRCKVVTEPLGTALIIAPWNYPVQLLLSPLVGAISAGCTVVLKQSPYVPHVSGVLAEMIRSVFAEEYIAVGEGHRDVNSALLAERWDMIFFTGSPVLGRTVMEAASRWLTPVVLELGGKSPCIVDKTADLAIAARRLAWGKALNAGQTCIAPDYLMIHRDVKNEFLGLLKTEWERLLGKDARQSGHYVRIVSDRAMTRLKGYLDEGKVWYGGDVDDKERYFGPTILTDVREGSHVLEEEIFGPVLPVIEFDSLGEVIDYVVEREKPLALYYFGKDGDRVLRETSSGGACINDVIMHIANPRMPFGGVGNSGMSAYHGKETFLRFSHQRSVLCSMNWLDLPFRYMPYGLFRWVKHLL